MSRTVPLNTGVTVTLNASGVGTCTIGPIVPGTSWTPGTAAVQILNAVSVPLFYLYVGNASPQNLYAATYTGNADSTDITGVILYPGSILTGVWTGGDANAQATLSIFGTQEIPG